MKKNTQAQARAKREEQLADLRQRVQAKLRAQRVRHEEERIEPSVRYDEVWAAGVVWLDTL